MIISSSFFQSIDIAEGGLPELTSKQSSQQSSQQPSFFIPSLGGNDPSVAAIQSSSFLESDVEDEESDSIDEEDLAATVECFPLLATAYNTRAAYPAIPNVITIFLPTICGIGDMTFDVIDDGWALVVKYRWPSVMFNPSKLLPLKVEEFHPSYVALDHAIKDMRLADPSPAMTIKIPLEHRCHALNATDVSSWLQQYEAKEVDCAPFPLLKVSLKVMETDGNEGVAVKLGAPSSSSGSSSTALPPLST